MVLLLFLPLFLSLPQAPPPAAGITWLTPTEYDFGEIIKGEPVSCAFRFHNGGAEALTVETVRPSCGCTTPNWTKTPVAADSTGMVEVQFNAKMPGNFRKLIKVYFLGQAKAEKLYVKGFVLGEEK